MIKLILVMGVFFTSLSSILTRLSTASPLLLVFYRLIFSVGLTLPLFLKNSRHELRKLQRRDILMSLAAGVCLGFHFSFYLSSLSYTSIASSTTLTDTEVFFVALLGVVFLREKLSVGTWAGMLITFAGSMVLAAGDAGTGHLSGDLLALAAAACSALYTIVGRSVRRRVSASAYTLLVYMAACATALCICTGSGTNLGAMTAKDLWIALGLAFFCTLLGHSIFSWGLKYEKASFVSVVKLLEPVFATVIGFFLFAERPGVTVLLGAVAIIAGIVIVTRTTGEDEKTETTSAAEGNRRTDARAAAGSAARCKNRDRLLRSVHPRTGKDQSDGNASVISGLGTRLRGDECDVRKNE